MMNHLRFLFIHFVLFLVVSFSLSAQSSEHLLDSLMNEYSNMDEEAPNIQLINRIALTYADFNPMIGIEYAYEGLGLSEKKGAKKDMASAYNSLGSNYLYLNKIDTSILFFKKGMNLYMEIGDKRGEADIKGNVGHIYYWTGNFALALEYYFESLWLYEELDYTEGVANQHLAIGNVYNVQKKLNDALRYDSIALRLYQDIGDTNGEALVLGNLGNIYSDLNEVELAMDFFEQSVKLYRELELPGDIGRNLVNMGSLYEQAGNYKQALETSQEAYRYCETSQNSLYQAYSLGNMGLAYLGSFLNYDTTFTGLHLISGSKKTLLSKSIAYLEESLAYASEVGTPDGADNWYRSLAMAYKYNGEYEKALGAHELFVQAKDSLESKERAIKIENLTTEREIAVRDKQIELDNIKLKLKRNERVYFGIGLALAIGLLVFIYKNYINQKKSNVQLSKLNKVVSNTNLQLEDKNVDLTKTLKNLKETQAQLIESERQKENEIIRRRISQDIHDDISSGLTKISWMAEILKKRPQAGEEADQPTLNKISDYARDTVSKLGEIIWATKPESDGLDSLIAYMRTYLNSYLEGFDINYVVDFPEKTEFGEINPALRRNLYLVLKESVHNAVKYSQGTLLQIGLTITEDEYLLTVTDNGAGISENEGNKEGNGLKNMKARMDAVGGQLQIKTGSNKGTKLAFTGKLY